jgi:hypothetical protein
MRERADANLTLADLVADLDHPSEFLLDDPWLDSEADPPFMWWCRPMSAQEWAKLK